MMALAQKMVLSPDLTFAHANKLADQYTAAMVQMHKKAVDWSTLGASATKASPEVEKKLRQTVKILDL